MKETIRVESGIRRHLPPMPGSYIAAWRPSSARSPNTTPQA